MWKRIKNILKDKNNGDEELENSYKKLLYELKDGNSAQIITTELSLSGEGKILNFNRTINNEQVLNEEERQKILEIGKPQCLQRADKVIFAEPNFKKERMIIFGGGHVAVPLVKFAKITGFYVVVIDDRLSFANTSRFPEADEIICESFENCLTKVKPTESDYFIIITRGHRYDKVCIRELMKYKESVYTGMIGSRRRTKIVLENLEEEGYDKKRLSRICTPIGLEIGAATTEEIGISIMAEVIKRKRLESTGNTLISRSDLEDEVIVKIAENTEACSVVTIMESTGSVPRNAGAKMLVYPDGRIFGSIGGGCVESSVICQARELIGTGNYKVISVSLDGEDAMAEGMVCGGTLKLLMEDCSINVI